MKSAVAIMIVYAAVSDGCTYREFKTVTVEHSGMAVCQQEADRISMSHGALAVKAICVEAK